MAMEMFAYERLDEVLDGEEAREFRYNQLSAVLRVLVSVARIDAFQAWLYRHPEHTREERNARWMEIGDRFDTGVDHSGLEEFRPSGWQAIPHLFSHPLYYIEYGIAQLGALQMWKRERHDHDEAIEGYRRALALGGSAPLPKLFETGGIRFAMDEAVLSDLVPEVMDELRGLLA